MNDRIEKLNNYVQLNGEVKLKELEKIFPDVSSMTLRRDLAQLEKQGLVLRVRSGAVSVDSIKGSKEVRYNLRAEENIEAKEIVAKKAVELIEQGRSLYLDSGSTIMCLAEILPNEHLSILTSGPNIGIEVAKKTNPSIMLIGGQLNRNNISVSGMGAIEFVKLVNIDVAFMATSGFSLEAGLTSGDYNECELKKYVIQKAKKVVVLMDSSKINKNMPYTFAGLKEIDVLVTDKKLPDEIIAAAIANNVVVY